MLIDRDNMAEIETILAEAGIFEHGLPMGAGVLDITTNSEELNAYLWSLKQTIDNHAKGNCSEMLQTDENYQKFLAFLQGLRSDEVDGEWKLVNKWVSATKWRGPLKREVSIWRHKETGAYKHEIEPFGETSSRGQMLMNSCFIRARCNMVETEHIARERLFQGLSEEQKQQCILTDSFVETGRSGTKYILRRNRPTLAFSVKKTEEGNEGELLAALCMHPLAYYTGSWIGVMPPSDEMLAHLLHIRADEHRYWKICNQHSPSHYLSGL